MELTIPETKPVPDITYDNLETAIRNRYDGYAVFTWKEYGSILDKLSESKFIVLPLNEMRTTFNSSKVVVGLRHDVDHHPFKALEMAKIEQSKGFRSTYFFLATADYFGKIEATGLVRHQAISRLLKAVNATGAEIGIHNDLLSVWMIYNLDPFLFNLDELNYYKSLGIPIYGTAAHGSALGRVIKIACNQLFSDFAKTDSVEYLGKKYRLGERSLKDYGFEYEAYFIDFGFYFSESGGKGHNATDVNDLIAKLDLSRPGDRIQILTHPVWWGKKE